MRVAVLVEGERILAAGGTRQLPFHTPVFLGTVPKVGDGGLAAVVGLKPVPGLHLKIAAIFEAQPVHRITGFGTFFAMRFQPFFDALLGTR